MPFSMAGGVIKNSQIATVRQGSGSRLAKRLTDDCLGEVPYDLVVYVSIAGGDCSDFTRNR